MKEPVHEAYADDFLKNSAPAPHDDIGEPITSYSLVVAAVTGADPGFLKGGAYYKKVVF